MSQGSLGFELYSPLPQFDENIAITQNVVDPAYKKYVEAKTTMSEKLDMLESVKNRKELEIGGYSFVSVNMSDPDSGFMTGTSKGFRFDGPDALDSFNQENKSEFGMQLQKKQVAELYNTSEDNVTQQMWDNVKNYQYNSFLKSFSKFDEPFEEFDKYRTYEPVDLRNTPIEMAIKGTGRYDKYGREFVEAINPNTGRRVSFDMGVNPYLSARNTKEGFDFYTALQTSALGESIDKAGKPYKPRSYSELSEDKVKEIASAIRENADTDGSLGELVDRAQVGFATIGALAGDLGDRATKALAGEAYFSKVTGIDFASLVDARTGQSKLDEYYGVKQSTRQDDAKIKEEFDKAFDGGDVLGVLTNAIKLGPGVIADSLPEMAAMGAVSLATGGIGTALGASVKAARAAALLMGASTGAATQTLRTAQEYKANNQGKDMPMDEVLTTFASYLPSFMLEQFALGKLFRNVLPSKLKASFRTAMVKPKAIATDYLKDVTRELGTEAIQEGWEGVVDRYFSQDQSKPTKSLTQIAFDSETVKDSILGGVTGGLMGGTVGGVNAAISAPSTRARNKQQQEDFEQYTTTTEFNTPADRTLSDKVLDNLGDFDVVQLTQLQHEPYLSKEAKRAVQKRRLDILIEQAKTEQEARAKGQTVTSTLPEGTTKESLFQEKAALIFHSDPSMTMQAKREQIEEAGKDLGISKETIQKTMKEVADDVRYGPIGFKTYESDIQYYDAEIARIKADTALTEDQKTQQITRYETARANTEASIKNLQSLQVRKLNSYLIALRDIATGGIPKARANYPRGGGFDIKVDDVRSGSFEKGSTVFGVINSVVSEINEMSEVMKGLGVEPNEQTLKNMKSILNGINSNINTIQGKTKAGKDVQKAIRRDKAKPVSQTTELTESELTGQVRALVELSNRQSKGRNVGANIQAFITSRTDEQIEQIRKHLEANPNEKASKMLDQIYSNKAESTQRASDIQTNTQSVLKTLQEQRGNFTEEVINKLDTQEKVLEAMKTLSDLAMSLKEIDESTVTKALAEYYNNASKKITKRLGEVLGENEKTSTQETNTETTTRDIQGVKVPFRYVSREMLKNLLGDDRNIAAATTKDNILLADDASVSDLDLNKQYKDILTKEGFDWDSIVKSLQTKEAVENYLLLHEFRHTQHIKNVGDIEEYTKQYKANPGRFEFDATLWAVWKLGLISKSQYSSLFDKVLKPLMNKRDTNTQSSQSTEETKPTEPEVKIAIEDYVVQSIVQKDSLWSKLNEQLGRPSIDTEFRVGEPTSTLAIQPVDGTKKYVNNVITKLNSITPVIYSLKRLISERTSKNRITGDMETTSMFSSAPYLQVLYDLDVILNEHGILETNQHTNKDGRLVNNSLFKLRPNVAVALDFSFRELFSDARTISDSRPYDTNDMAKTYGLNEKTMTRQEKAQIRELTDTYGVPRAVFAERLGKLILKNLGLVRQNESTATVGFYERVAVGLGIHALYYAESQGWVTLSKFSPSEWANTQPEGAIHFLSSQSMNKFVDNSNNLDFDELTQTDTSENGELDNSPDSTIEKGEKEISFIKLNEEVLKAPLKEYREILSKFKLGEDEKIGPTTKPVEFNPNTKVRNTNNLMNMTSFTKKIFKKLFKTPYTINTDLAQIVLENRPAIEAQLGILTEAQIAKLSKDDQISAKGKNIALKRELDNLLTMLDEDKKVADTHWFFRWFISKNGRNMINSVGVNPQSDKAVTRFLVVPDAFRRTITIDPNMTMDEYVQTNDFATVAYAIAQAFDVLKSDEKVAASARKLLETPAEQLYKDLFSGEFKKDNNKYGVGLENFGHALNVIQHIERFQNRATTNGTFETWLAIENDSTTSGYFIKLLQFPDTTLMETFGPKVGILPENYEYGWTEIHGLKALDNFLDIYKTLALKGSENIPTEYRPAKKNMYQPLYNACRQTYKDMFSALPRTENVNGKIKVTSALRSLFKNPTMIFGYTAGKKSIHNALADEITIGFIRDYISYKTDPNTYNADSKHVPVETLLKVFDRNKLFQTVSTTMNGERVELSLIEALRVSSISSIYVKVGKGSISLDNYFRDVLAPTYGAAVYTALDESFSAFKPYNNSMNYMFKTMFSVFSKALEVKMDTLRVKYKYGIPIEEERKAIEDLFNIMPVMRLAVNTMEETLQEGLLIMDTEKDYSLDAKTQSYYQDRQTNTDRSSMGYASLRKFIDGGQAGAVLPIHFMDGMGMSVMLDFFGDKIIPVHDAIVMSAYDNTEITQEYNKQMWRLGKEYNMFAELMFRFNDVMTIAEKEGLIDLDNDYIVTGQEVDENTPTITKFLSEIDRMNRENVATRDKFYKKHFYITNMDGNRASGYETKGDESEDYMDNAFINGWKSNRKYMRETLGKVYSDPNTFTSENELVELQRGGLENVGTRNVIFDKLQAMFPDMATNNLHLAALRRIISKVNPAPLMDFVVATRENIRNQGTLDGNTIILDLDNRTAIDPVTRISPYSTKSPAEIYAHELIHAGLRFGLSVGRNRFTKEIRQISQIMKQVMDTDLITWQDFMPDGQYDQSMRNVYEKNAKDIWNYIFNNKDNPTNLSGIHEFLAYGLTNEKVMAKLRSANLKGTTINPTDKVRLLDRVVNVAMALIDFVRGPSSTKFVEIFKTGYELVSNDFSMSQRNNMLTELERLFVSINEANDKAITRLRDHPARLIEAMFKFVAHILQQGNKIIRPYTTWASNWVDETGHIFDTPIITGSSPFEAAKMYANIATGLLFSRSRRQALTGVLRKTAGLSQQGTFATILREIQAPDESTAMLEQLSAYTRQLDGIGKAIETNMKLNFQEAFNSTFDQKKDLNDIEKKSLTKATLYTDLGSLLKFDTNNKVTNMDEIIEYLNDPSKVTAEINRLTKEVAKVGKQNNYYLNQARLLGRFMATGVGAINLNLNAKNIVEGRGTGEVYSTTPELIDNIDRLATMYALDYTAEDSKTVTGSLNKTGLENFLVAQRNFVKESIEEGLVEEIHMIKGYSKSIFDSSKDTKIGRIADRQKMKDMGYEPVTDKDTKTMKMFGKNKITQQEGFVLYQRNWAVQRRRDGSAYVMVGANTLGTTLWESALEIQNRMTPNATDVRQVNTLADRYKVEAESLARDATQRMMSHILTDKEIDVLSGGYTPIASPNGGYSDFRITMSNDDKVKYLGMKEDAFTILAKMYSSKNTKIQAPAKNKFLTDFLINDMQLNMQSSTNMSKLGKNYVRLERNSENKFLRDAYQAFPKELRDAIKKYDKEGNGLWVKDEWLQQLFGVPTVSLTDLKTVDKYTNTLTKYSIVVAEQIMKGIAYLAKQNIVIRYPMVLLGNIMSNLNLSIARGRNPSIVARRQIENAQNIRDYVSNQQALNRILTRQKFGTATEKELNSITWYQTRLAINPIKPLMDKGMYQAIVEDISQEELDNTGKINKMINTFAKNRNVPQKLRNVVKHLYMLEGTPLYDFMFQTTQYSDFVARATEYQLQMEEQLREPKLLKNGASNPAYIEKGTDAWDAFETKVSTDVWNAFINYDKPQSSLEQYANDMGLMMFTKFLKRIQHVLIHDLVHNPVSSAFFIASQVTIMDTSDIFEYNVFNRDIAWNTFAPWTNFMNAAIPVPIQFATGTGLFK